MKAILLILTISSVTLTSCSTSFTAQQKERITELDVMTPVISEEAYMDPTGKGELKAIRYASFAGLTAAALSRALEESIEARQKVEFRKKYGEAVTQVRASVPKMLSKDLEKKTEAELHNIPELNQKIKAPSENKFITIITDYGFKRVGKTADDKILMSPYINGTISLKLGDEQIVKPTKIKAQAYPNKQGKHDIIAYLDNKSLAMKDFENASKAFARAAKEKLEKKYR